MIRSTRFNSNRSYLNGFSLVEVLIALLLLSISLVPMMDALNSGIHSARVYGEYSYQHHHLRSRMEEVLAESYTSLYSAAKNVNDASIGSSFSDAGGVAHRRLVYLSYYDLANTDGDNDPFTIQDPNTDADANPYTGNETDIAMLWVRVELEGTNHSLETLVGVQ